LAVKDEDRVAALEERLAQLEQRGHRGEARSAAETAFWAVMHNVFPEEARRHFKAAGREQLLAARVYLDTWIGKLDHPTPAADEPAPIHESIEIK
jgi:hypothetical protein